MAENFQDNVAYGQSALSISGDALVIGASNTNATSKSIFFNNNSTSGALVWGPSANRTISLPDANGVVMLTSQGVLSLSAGTTQLTSGQAIFSNSNGVSFGVNGNTITASIATSLTNINFSAGTTSNNLSAVTFNNANNISFGLNGSVITGSVATSLTGVNLSAGTTSNNLSAFVLSNSNNVSFGLNGSTVTATATFAQSAQTQNVVVPSAGTQTATSGTVIFSNSNGISFGMSNSSVITASYTVPTQSVQTEGFYALGNTVGQSSSSTFDARTLSISGAGIVSVGYSNNALIISVPSGAALINFSAGTTSNNLGAVTFSNSNNVSFGLNGSTITGSIATSLTGVNLSAGTTSNNLSAFVFSNSNSISFGLQGSTVTASFSQSVQTEGNYVLGNTTGQSSSSTFDARTMSFSGMGGASVGFSGNAMIISAPPLIVSRVNMPESPWQTNFQISNATMSFQPWNPKVNITATQANLLMALSGNSASSGALTISMGIYTWLHSTMSLASSNSAQISWTSGSQTTTGSIYGGVSGTQYRTVSLGNWSVSAGDYMVGIWFRTTNNGTWAAFGSEGPTIVNALDPNMTLAYLPGYSSVSYTTAMQASALVTDVGFARTGGDALKQAGAIFLGSF